MAETAKHMYLCPDRTCSEPARLTLRRSSDVLLSSRPNSPKSVSLATLDSLSSRMFSCEGVG